MALNSASGWPRVESMSLTSNGKGTFTESTKKRGRDDKWVLGTVSKTKRLMVDEASNDSWAHLDLDCQESHVNRRRGCFLRW